MFLYFFNNAIPKQLEKLTLDNFKIRRKDKNLKYDILCKKNKKH